MRKLALAVVVLLMIAGGTASALKTFEIGPFAKTEAEKAAAALLAAKEGGEISAFSERPYYVEMDPLMIPIFQDNDLAGTIQIIFKLEVFGKANFKAVGKLQTKIGDALIKDFSYYIPRTMRNNQNLDVPLVKYRIKMISDKILGKDVISDAVIQSMTQIPARGG